MFYDVLHPVGCMGWLYDESRSAECKNLAELFCARHNQQID